MLSSCCQRPSAQILYCSISHFLSSTNSTRMSCLGRRASHRLLLSGNALSDAYHSQRPRQVRLVISLRRQPRCVPVMLGSRFGFIIPERYLPQEFTESTTVPKACEKRIETMEATDGNEAIDKVRKSTGTRVDLIIEGIGSEDRFSASMQAHQTRFNAFILAATRVQALPAVSELGEVSGRSRAIPIWGPGPYALQDTGCTAMGQSNLG